MLIAQKVGVFLQYGEIMRISSACLQNARMLLMDDESYLTLSGAGMPGNRGYYTTNQKETPHTVITGCILQTSTANSHNFATLQKNTFLRN